MTSPSYPNTVPYDPMLSSWDAGAALPLPTVSNMDGGNFDSRPTSLTKWTPISFSVLMSQAQYVTLENFMANVLGNESARYLMPIWRPTTGGYVTKEVTNDGGFKPGYRYGLDKIRVDFKVKVKAWL